MATKPLYYQSREWIIQRLAGLSGGAEQWEDWNAEKKTRDQMETVVEGLAREYPAEAFRGHNIAACECHATAYKHAKATE